MYLTYDRKTIHKKNMTEGEATSNIVCEKVATYSRTNWVPLFSL